MNKDESLALMRKPFEKHQIGRLPKPTKAQTDEVKNNYKAGVRCAECGGFHHPKVVHLDYIGHAAITDRLLDADPHWYWEPLSIGPDGLPVVDKDGGIWIKLTVQGVTRLGYGDSGGKTGGDAMKERIGDALRNAAMRFGAGLEFWHKGELHREEEKKDAANDENPDAAYLAYEQEKFPALEEAANQGQEQLQAAFSGIPKSKFKTELWKRHSVALKAIAEKVAA